MDTQSHNDLPQNNSTKTYKKVYPDTAVVYYVETEPRWCVPFAFRVRSLN